MPTAATTLRVLPIAQVDLEPVAALVNRAFAVYEIFKGTRTDADDYANEAGDDARVLLLEEAGRVIGTAMIAGAERFIDPETHGPAGTERGAVSSQAAADHPWTGALYVGLVGVEPELMSRGAGRRMMEEIERIALAEGFRRVALGTLRQFGLVEYYGRLGYRVIHEYSFPAGHWDVVVDHTVCDMVKDL